MADNSHKRETAARRRPRAVVIAAPLAVFATTAAVGAGVLLGTPEPEESTVQVSGLSADLSQAIAGSRDDLPLSRSDTSETKAPAKKRVLKRPAPKPVPKGPLDDAATIEAVSNADTRLWTTADLNIWDRPDKYAENVGLLGDGERVLVTGRSMHGRDEIVLDGGSRWVTSGYLTDVDPAVAARAAAREARREARAEAAAAADATCSNGTSVPSGVSENVKKVHEAVCANFPEIGSYGTFRDDGEHAQGLAIDIMVSGDRGWQVAEFVRGNYSELGVNYVIYSQKIWSVDRSGEGWRWMEDRGSDTANHYDHVHVTTY